MSPMGEPFFGRTAGEDGLVVWFQQADTNHDGWLSPAEMEADAQRFFQTLDLNHDGEIDPDEIAHYENVIAPEVRSGMFRAPPTAAAAAQQQGGDADRGSGHHGGGRGRHGGPGFAGGGSDEARAGRYGLLEIPEPVSSADADFNRGVSLEEFKRAADQRFGLLDVNHTGRLTLPELQDIREAAISNAKRSAEDQANQAMEPDDIDQPQM